MSLLSPERLHAGLWPEGVTLSVARGLRRRIERGRRWDGDVAGPGDAAWAPAVETLRRALAADRSTARTVDVTLSNHYCRYALFDDTATLSRPSERLAYVQHRMRSAFGDRTDDWDVRMQREQDTLIACAVPRTLINRVAAVLAERRLRLASLQPYFASVFDRFRNRIGTQSGWLAVQERERVVLGRYAQGRWRALVARRTPDDGPTALAGILDRESLLNGREPGDAVWLASAVRRYAPAELAQFGYRVHLLPDDLLAPPLIEDPASHATAA